METQPSQTETKATQPEIKPTHSVVGCLSAICGAFALGAVIFFLYLMGSDFTGALLDIPGMISLAGIAICAPLGLILGIIGLLLKKRKKLFPIIGVSISSLFILVAVVGYMVISYEPRISSGKLPIRDKFTSDEWQTGTNTDSSVEYYNDTLQFIVFAKNYRVWSGPAHIDNGTADTYTNLHIEVTAITNNTDPGAAFGIVCRIAPYYTPSHYYFAITLDGKYAISKYERGKDDVILTNNGNWATSDLISKNADSYRIGVDCYNGTLTLYVDGQQIDSVYDTSLTNGRFALFVRSGEGATSTVVGFDDFLAKEMR